MTRRESFNGSRPDLDDPSLDAHSAGCRRALAELFDLNPAPDRLDEVRRTLAGLAGTGPITGAHLVGPASGLRPRPGPSAG